MCLSPEVCACMAREADEGGMFVCVTDVGGELDVFSLFS